MKKIKVVVVGYGNIGQYACKAILNAEDMELCAIIRRSSKPGETIDGIKVVSDVRELSNVDVAILCVPSRSVEEYAKEYLALGISTVDSFDIHQNILALRASLDEAAKKSGTCAIISSGWDPGSDSVVRAILEAGAPGGVTYTNFGPGMSMGHSVAAKAIPGVLSAVSMTLPRAKGVHARDVYVVLEAGADITEVRAAILADRYFSHDETTVTAVEDITPYQNQSHGVNIIREGVSSGVEGQNFSFDMKILNPALTAQLMVSSARAATRQQPGGYTLIEIPIIDLLEGDRESLVARLV